MSARRAGHPGLNLGETDASTHAQAGHDVFGFWIFLMSDAVIFALLFATYGVMLAGTSWGPEPADVYKIVPAFIETVILLTSSLTFGMASITLKHSRGVRPLMAWLAVTLALGLIFLAMELHDFATMIANGAVPSRSGFLSSFFALVSLHGVHVLAGCLWIVVMMVQISVFGRDPRIKINMLRLGLFWHFLDIVWIAIFSLVYLQGLAR
ncbi:cytochrome c oxidase subunit 3 [Sphingobium sp. B2]|uniref:cytochrome c oxidase subunit 3 n=1 Tax=Sphingobium sp. B2 TaxID=2583228 RepID=UPI0011A4126E|nr:cytochrome c oxidase subunit 3 [Sphingobium sp. B2]